MAVVNRSESNPQRRTLGRGIEIAGGIDELAAFLRFPVADLQQWFAGRAPTPAHVFLALIDIVSANQLTRAPAPKSK